MENILGLPYKDFITTVALIIGPLIAVQTQKYLEKLQDRKLRRLNIFKTLMSTRATRLSQEHIKALNMIDIEFYGFSSFNHRVKYQNKLDANVTKAWKNYNYHLKNHHLNSYNNELWNAKTTELLIELLHALSQATGYNFDKVQIEEGSYLPLAHENIENTKMSILYNVQKILDGKCSIPMHITSIPDVSIPSDENSSKNNVVPSDIKKQN